MHLYITVCFYFRLLSRTIQAGRGSNRSVYLLCVTAGLVLVPAHHYLAEAYSDPWP